MLKRKGILVFFAILALVAVLSCALVACNDDDQKADETKTFTVAFKNGDETVKEVSVKEGEALAAEQIPSLIAPDGYEFKGWYVGDQKVEAGFKPTEDVVALAKLDPVAPPAKNKYTVSFSLGDGVTGDAPAAIEDVEEGSSIQLPACEVVRDGFDFAGWVLEGETYAVGDSYEVNSNVTFVASWDVDSRLVVSFKKDGAVIKSIKVEAGAQLAAADFPTAAELEKLHYTFQKWVVENSDPEVVVEAGYRVDASVALVAVYQEDPKYTISFDMGNCPIPTGKPADKVLYEGETFTFQGYNDSYWPGYEFLGWKAEGDPKTYNVNAEYTVGTADVEFVAQWRKIVSLNDFDGVWINSTSYYWLIINAGSGNNATIAGSLGGSGLQIQNDSQATFNAQTQILSYSPTSEMTYTLEIVDGKLSVSYNNSGNGAMSGKVELDKAAACGFEGNYVSGDQYIKIVEGGLILVRDSNANIKNGNSMSSGKNVHSFYFAMLRQGDSDYEVVYRDSEGFGDKGYKLTKDDKGNFVNAGTIFVKDPSEAKTYVSSNNSPKNHAATLYEYTVSDEKVYVFAEQSFDDAYITLSAEDEGKKIYSFSIQGSAEIYNYVIKIGDSAITFAGEERGTYAHAEGSDDKGELFLDGFGDGKLNDEAIQYSYDSQAKKLTIGEDTFLLSDDGDQKQYSYVKELDGFQGRYNLVGNDYYLELDGYGIATWYMRSDNSWSGTYTVNEEKTVITLIDVRAEQNGDYAISENGLVLTKGADVYQKYIIDSKAQGVWEYNNDAYVLIDNISVTITTKTKPAQKVNVTEGDLESGYSFNIDSVAYILKSEGSDIKLNDVTLVKAALFLSDGTYYAYHNMYELTVSRSKITEIKYLGTSVKTSYSFTITNEQYQYVDGNKQYAFEIDGNSYAITSKTDGYYFSISDKEYKLSDAKEQDKNIYSKWVKSDDETISLSFANYIEVTVEGGSHAGKYDYSLSSYTVTIGGESLIFKIYGEALLVSSESSSPSEYIGVYEFANVVTPTLFKASWIGKYVDKSDENFLIEIVDESTLKIKKDASSEWTAATFTSFEFNSLKFTFESYSPTLNYDANGVTSISGIGSWRNLIKLIFPEDWSGAYQTADGQYYVTITETSISVGAVGSAMAAGTNIVTTVANSDYTFEAGSVSYRIYKEGEKLMLSVDSAAAQELVARVADKFKDAAFWKASGGNNHFVLDGFGGVIYCANADDTPSTTGTYVYNKESGKLTFAGLQSPAASYNGDWTLSGHDHVITSGSNIFQCPIVIELTSGSYMGEQAILEVNSWGVILYTPDHDPVETYDITVEDGSYKFNANGSQHTLAGSSDTITLDGETLSKIEFPLSAGTYYAYHNIYNLSVSATAIKLTYLGGSAVTASETRYSFDESGKVKCEIIVGGVAYGIVNDAEEGKQYIVVDGKQYEFSNSEESIISQPLGVWKLEEGSGKKITISGSTSIPYDLVVEGDDAHYQIATWKYPYKGNITIGSVEYAYRFIGEAFVLTSESEDAPLVGVYIIESVLEPDPFSTANFGLYASDDLNIMVKITGAKELSFKGNGVEEFTVAEGVQLSGRYVEFTVNEQKYRLSVSSSSLSFYVGDSYSSTTLNKAILPEAEFLGSWQTEDGSIYVRVSASRIFVVLSSSSDVTATSISTVEEGKKYEFTVSGVKYTISLSEDNQLMFAKEDEAEQKLIARVADKYAGYKYENSVGQTSFVLDGYGMLTYTDKSGNVKYGDYYIKGNELVVKNTGTNFDTDPKYAPWEFDQDDTVVTDHDITTYNKVEG